MTAWLLEWAPGLGVAAMIALVWLAHDISRRPYTKGEAMRGDGQLYVREDYRPVDSGHAKLSRDIGRAVDDALWRKP